MYSSKTLKFRGPGSESSASGHGEVALGGLLVGELNVGSVAALVVVAVVVTLELS